MTGEITLRGQILPIGGLNEKLLAAKRHGLTTVLIPKENEVDLREIPDKVKEGLNIIPIEKIEEAIPYLFDRKIKAVKESPGKSIKSIKSKGKIVAGRNRNKK